MSEFWLAIAPPPTPNGDLHLGHLAGPYLALDVFARHQRRTGAEVVAMCGLDDNQSYTALRAINLFTTATEVADHFGRRIEQAWRHSRIDVDLVVKPRSANSYREFVQDFLRTLYERGRIVARTRPLPYCPRCSRWAFEAYVVGGCPHCGQKTSGNACEPCGMPNDCGDLVDPRCAVCDSPCDLRDNTRLYFPLEPYRESLERLWRNTNPGQHVVATCRRLAAGPLPEIAVSFPSDWGIEVTVPGFTDQRTYVWLEMAAGRLAGTRAWQAAREGHLPEFWREPWRVVEFFGFDNGYFYAALAPALMLAYDDDIRLPDRFVTNEFYRLDGEKFSTSRDHAVWLLDTKDTTPIDHLRLHLCWDRPATSQTSFSWDRFHSLVYENLLPRWFDWLSALARRRTRLAGADEEPEAERPETCRFAAQLDHTLADVGRAYSAEEFSPRRALRLLDILVSDAAEHGADSDHITDEPGQRAALASFVRLELRAAALFALGVAPIAPQLAEQLWQVLGLPGTAESTPWPARAKDLPVAAKMGDVAEMCRLLSPADAAIAG